MKCPKCETEISEDAKFCKNCGTKLEEIKENAQIVEEKVEDIQVKEEIKEEKNDEIKKEEFQEKDKISKRKGIKKFFILIIILLVLSEIIVGGFLLYDRFFYKYDEKVGENLEQYFSTQDQKYLDKINEIVSKYENNQDVIVKIKEVSKQKIQKEIEQINEKEYTSKTEIEKEYETLEKKLEKLSKIVEKNEKEKYQDQIKEIKNSKLYYIDGVEKYNNKNYDKAYISFGKVIEEDKLYKSAQDYMSKCIGDTITLIKKEFNNKISEVEGKTFKEISEKYIKVYEYLINQNKKIGIDLNNSDEFRKLVKESIQKVLEENEKNFNENINNKQYDEIKNSIVEVLKKITDISDNREYKDFIESSLKLISDLTIKTAESMVNDYKYDDAKELIKNVKTQLNVIKTENSYAKQLEEKFLEIEGKMPKSLLELSTRSKDISIALKQNSFNDADGNKYDKGIMAYCLYDQSITCTYNINGDYSKLKAKYGVCSANASNDVSVYIKIYGDEDKLLYTSDAITWSSMPKDLDVDITGVKMLKIEFVAADLDRNVFIGNPVLYK